MMGRVVLMMKRWWLVALVFTLALSLTSCSRKALQEGTPTYGLAYCDGDLGSYDVYVYETGNGLYGVSVIPVSVNSGDIVSIVVANQSLAYKELQSEVVVNSDREIMAGTLTDTELETYDILAISAWEQGVTFLERTGAANFCYLPLPGDGL